MERPAYVLVVSNASQRVLQGIDDVRKSDQQFANLTALVLTENTKQPSLRQKRALPVKVVPCHLDSPTEIKNALRPYLDGIRAVVCAGERHIQHLRTVSRLLPRHVLAASPEALEIATDKRLMREAFTRYTPEISPAFLSVEDATKTTINKIEAILGYPVIVKPTNLASSLMVQACGSRKELRTVLEKTFDSIHQIYASENRKAEPGVIVEEYLEGSFYSIDTYTMGAGQHYFCPPVAYIPAKQLEIDDFFIYKRFIPAKLDDAEIAAANAAVTKALAAIGLTNSSAHVELVLTKQGWKVIELGPRVGRFRQVMYKTSYGFNHYMNDVLIHLGKKPSVKTVLQQPAAGYLIYPETEGRLREVTGLEKLRDNPLVCFFRVQKQPGDVCRFAKNGGHAIAEFVIASPDKSAYDKLVGYIEKEVKAVID